MNRIALLVAFYGDDFTGSTDALEVLAMAGVPTLLFLSPPTDSQLAQAHAEGIRAIGVAGRSRSLGPPAMRAELAPALARLHDLSAPLVHYKVCSTYDSSPEVGSIGLATELGLAARQADWSPAIVGAPRLGRFQAFGHLFAAAGEMVHRLDRHPTMARHPVTPMGESDLLRHLARQTARRIELIDFTCLKAGRAQARLDSLRGADCPVVFLDVVDADSQRAAGALVWENRGSGLFSASSSGLTYALAAHWQASGLLPDPQPLARCARVERVLVVSGSCSPITAGQIRAATQAGFYTVALDLAALFSPDQGPEYLDRCLAQGRAALAAGNSVVVCSALGPDDPRVQDFDDLALRAGLTRAQAQTRVADGLALLARHWLTEGQLHRLVVAGGDSSGAVMAGLGVEALRVKAAFSPGAPLCEARGGGLHGLEVVLKGGQMGQENLFVAARDGLG